jgi:hypothetical protein
MFEGDLTMLEKNNLQRWCGTVVGVVDGREK